MGKILRAHYLYEHPEHAARLIDHEVGEHKKAAASKGMKAGVRLNITSDIPYERLMPKKFFDKHKDVQFYDYTKIPGRLGHEKLPKNYHLSLSHTGTGHPESNDTQAIAHLNKGGVLAMVYHRGKSHPVPTHVEDVQTGKRWPVVNGDQDDNTFDRHKMGKVPKGQGVVSGLKVKGVSNEKIGPFANKVDPDGIIRINHPKKTNPFHILANDVEPVGEWQGK
jgi:hypothetical protein